MTAEIHEGLPIDRYLELSGESATGLKDILVSPLLYRWRQEYGRPDKDTLRVGRAVHTAILEPYQFAAEYVVWDGGRIRRGKDWDAFQIENANRTILTVAQHQTAIEVARAVHAHPIASALLREPGKAEVSITWTHGRTQLPCKSRVDWLCSSIVDVKTCREPSPHLFGGAAARLGYHVQLAFYAAALDALGMPAIPVKIIAAQNQEPYDVVVYSLSDDVLILGEQLYEQALDKVVACRASGTWPGIAPNAELPLKLPAWANPMRFDDELDLDEPGWSVAIAKDG